MTPLPMEISHDPEDPPGHMAEMMYDNISRSARFLTGMGWNASFFGNISIKADVDRTGPKSSGPIALPMEFPNLAGRTIAITMAGSTMSGIEHQPRANAGIYRLSGPDALYLMDGTGPPSSELLSHLSIHDRLDLPTSAIIHCHIGRLLDRLEGSKDPPAWMRTVPDNMAGSKELAIASADAASVGSILIWPGHGIVAVSSDIDGAISLLEKVSGLLS